MFCQTLGRVARVVVPLSTLLVARIAAAAAPSQAELNAARELFIAAEKDEDAQRWNDALVKLERVAQVKLTSGVRYHTALCEEHLGHLVAALSDYEAAAEQAHAENATDVLRLVDRRIADSTERTPQVVVVVVPSVPDAILLLDGQPIAAGAAIRVDPGTHTIDASASDRQASATTVTVQERDSTRVEVKLEPVTSPSPPPPAAAVDKPQPHPPAQEHRPSGHPTLTIVAAAAALGLAAAGVGAYLVAGSEHADSVQICAQMVSLQADACDAHKNAVRAWDWVGVAAWVGAAAAGTLAIVSLVRPHRDSVGTRGDRRGTLPAPSARVVVGPASMGLEGTF